MQRIVVDFPEPDAPRIATAPHSPPPAMSAICTRCGFNYMASFNIAFRREAGMTPSEYRTRCAGK